MKVEQMLADANKAFRQIQKDTGNKPEARQFTRSFLLALNDQNLSPEDMKLCLVCAVDTKKGFTPESLWTALETEIYETYMLSIGTEEKPFIQPVYGCWLNLKNQSISTKHQIDYLAGLDDNSVWLDDYRNIDAGIDWLMVAEG